jgi:signal transduction histidine kinase
LTAARVRLTVSDLASFMHPPDFDIFTNNKAFTAPSSLFFKFRSLAIPGVWLNRIIRRWTIHQKIRYGYILSLSIAVLGTGVGLSAGEYCDDKVAEQYRSATNRYELIDHLEKSILKVNLYQRGIILSPENSIRQKYEVIQLFKSITEARELLSKLKLSLKDYQGIPVEDAVKLKILLQTYDTELESFIQLIHSDSKNLDVDNLTPKEIQAAKQFLGMRSTGEQAPQFEQLSKSLKELVESTSAQRTHAENSSKDSKILRVIIIVASMTLSIAIALALAFYTSRAIARPIKAVTKIAKRATEERNFELQAPVTSEDEIGVLATSLNQLIQQVSKQIRELQQAQAQLIQSEKMSSLGHMVAGIAHEINNPVSFIHGNLTYANNYIQDLLKLVHLYEQYYPQPVPEIQNKREEIELDFLSKDLIKLLSSMQLGTERIRQIILSLRNFSHLDEAERKVVDIHEGIDNTLLLLSYQLKPTIEVIKHYDALPLIECYPAQLNQVFMNILTNAIDAILANNKLSQGKIVIGTKLIESNQIEVWIQDNSYGIAPDIKNRIFDPFFTTKPIGKGTGMGLAICYQIIEKHQGKITAISEPDQGAKFIVTLPINMIIESKNRNIELRKIPVF